METKYCGNDNCTKQQPLLLSDFYRYKNGDYYKVCKDCHNDRIKKQKEDEAKQAGVKAYKEGIITYEEIEDAISLFKSCRSRIHSCKYGIDIYKEIQCGWENPYEFLKDIITKKENKEFSYWNSIWVDWKEQRKTYLSTANEDDKPELDRIRGGTSPYIIGNVRCLSKIMNREFAKKITPLGIKLYKDGKLINERHFTEIEKSRAWIMSQTNCKCSRNKILNNFDKKLVVLSARYSFRVNSLNYMLDEFQISESTRS